MQQRYHYSSVQKINPDGMWTSHIQTDDFKEARNEAEIDHLDHPERYHGVIDNFSLEVVHVIEPAFEVVR